MTMDMTIDTLARIAMKGFMNGLEKNGLIISENQKTVEAPGGRKVDTEDVSFKWIPLSEIKGIDKRGLKGMKVHPLAAQMLTELSHSERRQRTWFDKLLGISKVGQFFTPGIIWTYDLIQAAIGGVNLLKSGMNMPEAYRQVMSEGEAWKSAVKTGAFQTPGLATEATVQTQKDIALQSMDAEVSASAKAFGKIFQVKTKAMKDIMEQMKTNPGGSVLNGAMLPYQAIGHLTWSGDNVGRMATFLTLKEAHPDKSDGEIGVMTADIHGAYARTSPLYRSIANRIFFVHTFRLLMPHRIAKGFTDLPRMMVEEMLKKGDYTNAEKAQAARAFASTVGIPLATYMLMTSAGWEPDEEGLPDWWKATKAKIPFGLPFPTLKNHWKFKKTVDTPNGKREMVVGINNLVNMPVKWIERATKNRPERLDDLTYPIANMFRWEFNPLYRIALDIWSNESSMGGKPPYNRADPIGTQIYDATKYSFGNMFRIYNHLASSAPTTALRRQAKQELKNGMNITEKILLGYYTGYTKVGVFTPLSVGYTYTRNDRRRRLGSALGALSGAISEQKRNLKSLYKDKPEILRQELRDLAVLERERKRKLKNIFIGDK